MRFEEPAPADAYSGEKFPLNAAGFSEKGDRPHRQIRLSIFHKRKLRGNKPRSPVTNQFG